MPRVVQAIPRYILDDPKAMQDVLVQLDSMRHPDDYLDYSDRDLGNVPATIVPSLLKSAKKGKG